MSNKVEVKDLITVCPDLDEVQKSSLRRLLDQNVVGIDFMMNQGNLIGVPALKLVISDNAGNFLSV